MAELSLSTARPCPICAGKPTGSTFPYASRFNNLRFDYLKCGECKSVFVDPVPSPETFSRIYAKSEYHDRHYKDDVSIDYSQSVRLLNGYLKPGCTVLDYGCGMGGFLKACAAQNLIPLGVEFDADAAQFAAKNAQCEVMSVETFTNLTRFPQFDAIHIGDVLEHLPDPADTLSQLLKFLKLRGVLFVEGPLEANSSPVYWAALFFGRLKRLFSPQTVSTDPPTHLFRTSADAQKGFFNRLGNGLSMRRWHVYETGWPYRNGGLVKRSIAAFAIFLSTRSFLGATFGNRFEAILIKQM